MIGVQVVGGPLPALPRSPIAGIIDTNYSVWVSIGADLKAVEATGSSSALEVIVTGDSKLDGDLLESPQHSTFDSCLARLMKMSFKPGGNWGYSYYLRFGQYSPVSKSASVLRGNTTYTTTSGNGNTFNTTYSWDIAAGQSLYMYLPSGFNNLGICWAYGVQLALNVDRIAGNQIVAQPTGGLTSLATRPNVLGTGLMSDHTSQYSTTSKAADSSNRIYGEYGNYRYQVASSQNLVSQTIRVNSPNANSLYPQFAFVQGGGHTWTNYVAVVPWNLHGSSNLRYATATNGTAGQKYYPTPTVQSTVGEAVFFEHGPRCLRQYQAQTWRNISGTGVDMSGTTGSSAGSAPTGYQGTWGATSAIWLTGLYTNGMSDLTATMAAKTLEFNRIMAIPGMYFVALILPTIIPGTETAAYVTAIKALCATRPDKAAVIDLQQVYGTDGLTSDTTHALRSFSGDVTHEGEEANLYSAYMVNEVLKYCRALAG
jgi:hypothetical protein